MVTFGYFCQNLVTSKKNLIWLVSGAQRCEQISENVQISAVGKYWKMCKDLWVNISVNAKIVNICWQISGKNISQKERQEHAGSVMHASYVTHARREAHAQSGSFEVPWANIRRRVTICGQISADA